MADQLPNGTAVLLMIPDADNPSNFIALKGQTTTSFALTVGEVDYGSKDSDFTPSMPGKRSWSGSVELVYHPSQTPGATRALQLAQGRTVFPIGWSEGGTVVRQATAYITSASLDFPDADTATASLDLRLASDWAPASGTGGAFDVEDEEEEPEEPGEPE